MSIPTRSASMPTRNYELYYLSHQRSSGCCERGIFTFLWSGWEDYLSRDATRIGIDCPVYLLHDWAIPLFCGLVPLCGLWCATCLTEFSGELLMMLQITLIGKPQISAYGTRRLPLIKIPSMFKHGTAIYLHSNEKEANCVS